MKAFIKVKRHAARFVVALMAAWVLLMTASVAFAGTRYVADNDSLASVFGTDKTYVVDNAGLLDSGQVQKLEAKARELSEKYKANIVILTENALGQTSSTALQKAGQNTEISAEYAYVAEYYEEVYGAGKDGIICYVNMNDRFVDIDSTGSIQSTFDHKRVSEIREDIMPWLSNGKYASAFDEYLDGVEDGFGAEGRFKLMFRTIGAFGAAIVAAIGVGISKSGLKTARVQNQAMKYEKPGSMDLTKRSDIYMYSTMNRVRRQTERSSSGGGGGSFHSSSGSSHTASGGHF